MTQISVSFELLSKLEPLSSLSAASRRQLAAVCSIEAHPRGGDPLRLIVEGRERLYLLSGQLLLTYRDGSTDVVVGGTDACARSLESRSQAVLAARAITEIELLRVDDDLLDIFLTWDQLAGPGGDEGSADAPDWRTMSGIYAAQNLATGVFAALPPAHINMLLSRFARIRVARDQVIIRQGAQGDHYYLIESGRAAVAREVAGASLPLAELVPGDAFGEEALLASASRNATVTMKSDGVLLRLDKQDFFALLREPLLRRVSRTEAEAKVQSGAQWLDVRYPAEFQSERMPGAINIPLNEIRNAVGSLDTSKEYIAYCQSGRRSSAAAFLLSQRGYRAFLLDGGLRAAAAGARPAD